MDKPVIKCFRTYKGNYCYDRSTNSILSLTKEDYDELLQIERGEFKASDSKSIYNLKDRGFLKGNVVEEIQHPATIDLEHIVNNHMSQLVLQVTQQCNLRCCYCIFSGNYYNREHSSQRMTFETAKRAVDFFMEHSLESKEVTVGFYGGEPFLEFNLIKSVITYCKENYSYRTLKFNVTTNGVLLNKEIIQYCIENDMLVTISIDGSKEEHDANRVTRDGKGTFDIILNNIRLIEKIDKNYFLKNLLFNTVINPKLKLNCVGEYFSTSQLFQDSHIIFGNLTTSNLKEKSLAEYNTEFWLPRNYELLKLFLYILGKIDKQKLSKLIINSTGEVEDFVRKLRYREPNRIDHHGGPCVPCAKRLFITVDGKMYPCERVSENIKRFCIGALNNGLNMENINYILNCGKLSEIECKNCWNLLHCNVCISMANSESGVGFNKSEKLACCNESMLVTMTQLKEYCTLKEFGYQRTYEKEENRI